MKSSYPKNIYAQYKHPFASESTTVSNHALEHKFASIFTPGPFYSFLWDWTSQKMISISDPNQLSVFDPNKKQIGLIDFVKAIHPDDVPHFQACEAFALQKFVRDAKLVFNDFKVSYCLRILTSTGSHKLFLHQVVTTSTDELGRMQNTLVIHSQIDHILSKNPMTISMINLRGGASYLNKCPYEMGSSLSAQYSKLTRREKEVLELLGQGLRTKEIAKCLHISSETVTSHRGKIKLKLDAKSTPHMLAKAVKYGLV